MILARSLRLPVFGFLTVFIFSLLFQGCRISYSFTGAAISPEVKTFSVYYFPNRAELVNPSLSQQLTDFLQEKLMRQTSLDMATEGGDLEFDGQITNYSTQPMNISEGDVSAQTRLSISVKVKYTNNKNHDEDWESSFTAYEDYDSSSPLSDVEDVLLEEIIEKLAEDIFNASIANW